MKKLILLMAASFAFIACKNTDKKSESVASTVSTTTQDTIVYEHEYIVKVGDIAPDFTLSYTDGKPFSLSALRGKVIMLQFTASWCGICRGEMPHIESRIWQPHKENPDFVLVGVDREETKEDVQAYTKKIGTTYPMLLDTAATAFSSYALRQSGITRNVLIDRDGKIVKLTRRFQEDEFNELVQCIDSLLLCK
jgi:peroxiredoxin